MVEISNTTLKAEEQQWLPDYLVTWLPEDGSSERLQVLQLQLLQYILLNSLVRCRCESHTRTPVQHTEILDLQEVRPG